ncbi:MAG TPA: hypothetical protein VF799_09905 [Geobacteraceae bacterium]
MYNPLILAFDRDLGAFTIPLQMAKKEYGRLPSEFKLLSPRKTAKKSGSRRVSKRTLNLDFGVSLKEWLAGAPGRDLKGFVVRFFAGWHRDYKREFDLSPAPLVNLNDPRKVRTALKANAALWEGIAAQNTRDYISSQGVVRKDTLNSIPDNLLLDKAVEMLVRKERSSAGGHLAVIIAQLKGKQALGRLGDKLGVQVGEIARLPVDEYADEIASTLGAMSRYLRLEEMNGLRFLKGSGIEFDYAPRDISYLGLGRKFGDCTSDQMRLQVDIEIENIFWTVFSWILDRNYQILRVFRDGRPLVKCHLMPLCVDVPETERSPYFFLSVDAVETVPLIRTQGDSSDQTEFMTQRDELLRSAVAEIARIADRMGIDAVYAEKFSNAGWVRDRLARYPEIYLNTMRIVKIDELEDVYCCAREFCRSHGFPLPERVFMELQVKNSYLLPGKVTGHKKSFAILRGTPKDGIPAKMVVGV